VCANCVNYSPPVRQPNTFARARFPLWASLVVLAFVAGCSSSNSGAATPSDRLACGAAITMVEDITLKQTPASALGREVVSDAEQASNSELRSAGYQLDASVGAKDQRGVDLAFGSMVRACRKLGINPPSGSAG
jgi:hypothetical protein